MNNVLIIPRGVFISHIFSEFNYSNIGALSSTSKKYYDLFMGGFKKLWERRINSHHPINAPMTFFEFIGGCNQLVKKYRFIEDLYLKNKSLFDPRFWSNVNLEIYIMSVFGVYFPSINLTQLEYVEKQHNDITNGAINDYSRLLDALKKVEEGHLEASKDIRSLKISKCLSKFYSVSCFILSSLFVALVAYGYYSVFTDPNCDPLGFND